MAAYLFEIPINAVLYDGNNYEEIISNCTRFNVMVNPRPSPTNNSLMINEQYYIFPNQYLVFWPSNSDTNYIPIIYERNSFEGRFRKFLLQ
jgi:hypothetical protein